MDENTLCVVFSCPQVDPHNTHEFITKVSEALTADINHLYLLLTTPGGSVNHGIFIYNFLIGLPVKVTTHNVGQVDSIGNVIFVAGEHRFATPTSTFLFHGVATGTWNGLSVPQAKEAVSQLENDEKRMTAILRERTGFNARELTKFYREGKSITPETALLKEVITEIKQVEIGVSSRRLVIDCKS